MTAAKSRQKLMLFAVGLRNWNTENAKVAYMLSTITIVKSRMMIALVNVFMVGGRVSVCPSV